MAAVRALYSEEAASAIASPVFPHVAPPPRGGSNPLAALAVFDSDALLYYAFSSNLVNGVEIRGDRPFVRDQVRISCGDDL
jgi:hypothetical protein